MISETPSREVKSVRTAFRLVAAIQERDGATLADLTEELDLAKSTVHNYVRTMESMGYIVERNGRYRLGLRFLTNGMAARNGIAGRDAVTYRIRALAEELSQPVWWVLEEFGRGIFVEKAVPDDAEKIYGRVGKRSYLHVHAPGKAILATLPAEYRDRIVDYHGLPVHTTKTKTERASLQSDLDRAREQGYAISDGEAALGVQSVGVAFEDSAGITHAIGVFGHSHELSRNTLEQDIPSLLQTAVADIESTLEGEQ